jgi:hypothetical protein
MKDVVDAITDTTENGGAISGLYALISWNTHDQNDII